MGLIGRVVVGLIAGSLVQTVTCVERRGYLFTLLIGVLGVGALRLVFASLLGGDSRSERSMCSLRSRGRKGHC